MCDTADPEQDRQMNLIVIAKLNIDRKIIHSSQDLEPQLLRIIENSKDGSSICDASIKGIKSLLITAR